MRLVIIAALLTGLLLAPMAVFAEGSNVSVNETGNGTISEEATTQAIATAGEGNMSAESADLATLFGKVHATLLMATEEAFDYLLIPNESTKQEFYDEIATAKEDFTAFEEAAAKSGDNQSALKEGNDQIKAEYENMTTAADTMFSSFGKSGKPVLEDVQSFEKSVDLIFNATDKAWMQYNNETVRTMTVNTSERILNSRLFSAIQESYAYPVTGDKTEKEEAMADFSDFDARVATYEKMFPDASYDNLKAAKKEIMQAAETMFATYEKDGKVNTDDFAALETLVEKLNDNYMKLITQSSSENSSQP